MIVWGQWIIVYQKVIIFFQRNFKIIKINLRERVKRLKNGIFTKYFLNCQ